jgi:putative endonuclease
MRPTVPPTDPRKASGIAAEQAAASLLERLGHRVLARNLRLGHLEVDVVSTDPSDGSLVLTEVKARRGGRHAPELRVDRRKRRHLETAARMLLCRPGLRNLAVRFDVVAVTLDAEGHPDSLRHVPRAFDAEGRRPGQ